MQSPLAQRANVKHLRVCDPTVVRVRDVDNGLYLGQSHMTNVFSGAQRSVLVLGPTRSGKTSALIVPNVLLATSAVVTTSTKHDVMVATTPLRSQIGHVLLFDPSGTVACPPRVRRVGWSPLDASRTWDSAVLMAAAMVDASRLRARGAAADDHWTERARSLLAPLLHAASLEKKTVADLAEWVDLRAGAEALTALVAAHGDHHQAATSLGGILATEARELSGIWSTASGILTAWRTDAARAATLAPPLDVAAFVSSTSTLHVVSPSRHQAATAPIIAGLLDSLVHAAYDRHADGARLLLALDELANVAPLPSLPSIVSEGGAQGVRVLGCLQDLSQARVRWGVAADGFLSLFPATVVLPGIADRATLEAISSIAGRHDVAATSVSSSRLGRTVTSMSTLARPRLPVDEIARGRAGHAITLDASNHVGFVRLTPAHLDMRFSVDAAVS